MPFPRPQDESVLICVLLDGLGYYLVQQASFLSDLLEDVQPLKTVLGYSCAAQPSILTGLSPAEHGGLCVYYRSSKSIFGWTRLLRLLPRRFRAEFRKRVVDWTRRLYRITGYFNVWEIPFELLHRFQLYERKSFYSRHPLKGIPTILDEVRDRGIPVSSYYWNTPVDQIFSETEDKLAARQARLHYLYISRTDHLLHVNGNDLGRVGDELDVYANRIRRIHRIAKENYREVGLLIFSDHGMMDVTGEVDVMTPIAKLPYRLGADYLAFYDATMARFWFDNPSCRQPIMDAVAGVEGLRLLPDRELEDLGSLFFDRRYGEAIYLAEGGKIISPSFFGRLRSRGMHGYHPQEPGYEAFVGFSSVDIGEPKSIMDLYSIMRQSLLDLEEAREDDHAL